MLPPGAAAKRAEQMAALAEAVHAAAGGPRTGELLAELEANPEASLSARAVLRQARRDFDRATRLPPDFVRDRAAQMSAGYHAWARARRPERFRKLHPGARAKLGAGAARDGLPGLGNAPYDGMIDQHEPGMTTAAVDRLFAELREGLVPLARDIVAAARRHPGAGARRLAGRRAGEVSPGGDGPARVRLPPGTARCLAPPLLLRFGRRSADDDPVSPGSPARFPLQRRPRNRPWTL